MHKFISAIKYCFITYFLTNFLPTNAFHFYLIELSVNIFANYFIVMKFKGFRIIFPLFHLLNLNFIILCCIFHLLTYLYNIYRQVLLSKNCIPEYFCMYFKNCTSSSNFQTVCSELGSYFYYPINRYLSLIFSAVLCIYFAIADHFRPCFYTKLNNWSTSSSVHYPPLFFVFNYLFKNL